MNGRTAGIGLPGTFFCFIFKQKASLGPDSADFVFSEYFDLKPTLDSVDIVIQSCVCSRLVTNNKSDHSFGYSLSSFGAIGIGKWYGLVPCSSIVSVTTLCVKITEYFPFCHSYCIQGTNSSKSDFINVETNVYENCNKLC